MVQFVALFTLVLGASGLQTALEQQNALKEMSMKQTKSVSMDVLEKTTQTLDKYLASFEKRDLKDSAVYAEYLAVRDGAKRAAEMLQNARKSNPPAPSDWQNDDDEAEVQDVEAEQKEAAEFKAKMEEEQEDDIAKEAKEEAEAENQEEMKKEVPKLQKKKKLHLKPMSEEKKEKIRSLQSKFSSPYRAASKMPEQEVEVIDEGVGSYGKYKDKIFGKSLLEESQKPTIEETIKRREAELEAEAARHQKAIAMAEHAHKLCGESKQCNYRVEQKLKDGFYDRYLARNLNQRDSKTVSSSRFAPSELLKNVPSNKIH